MTNWIKQNFGVKNFFILITVVLVIAGFLIGPKFYNYLKGSQYKGITEAKITNIIDKTATIQHHNGTNTQTIGYDVSYVYNIEGKNYSNIEFIEPNSEIKQLFDKFTSEQNCLIEIKYSVDNPSESIISQLLYK